MPARAVSVHAMAAPGSLTVPPLAGWQILVLILVGVLAVAVAFLVLGALATGRRRPSPEWEAWLAGRSRRLDAPGEAPTTPVRDAPDEGARLS